MTYGRSFGFLWEYRGLVATGVAYTILYTVLCVVLGPVIGIPVAIARLIESPILRMPLARSIESFPCAPPRGAFPRTAVLYFAILFPLPLCGQWLERVMADRK